LIDLSLQRYAFLALAAAAAFGASTPLAKLLLEETSPIVLAGLLYLGSGLGLALLRLFQAGGSRAREAPLAARDWGWLAGAILAGGIAAPVLLLWGLRGTQAVDASLLLNFEGVITALAAGSSNLALGLAVGGSFPASGPAAGAVALGFFAYGVSLVLFIYALRHLGTARTAAHFSTAPFIGAVLAVPLLGEPATAGLIAAATLMAIATWLVLTERHAHEHRHERMTHNHAHVHDQHHQHEHHGDDGPEPHVHEHVHEPMRHAHPHVPDLHHRHRH
jgi:drug/metabolite transporter (DMT)-like permease